MVAISVSATIAILVILMEESHCGPKSPSIPFAGAALNQQMPSLHKDRATFFAEGLMGTQVRASEPRTWRIPTVLILKDTLNDKDFFTTKMPVGVEIRLRRPAY